MAQIKYAALVEARERVKSQFYVPSEKEVHLVQKPDKEAQPKEAELKKAGSLEED